MEFLGSFIECYSGRSVDMKASAKNAENAKNADNIRRLTNKERKQADSCTTKPVEER